MGVADQVDICVTCVSDKPPKLPLREELVSLGVEVILNGHGVGAKAVKYETRRSVKELRKEFEKKNKSSIICFPWKSQKQKMQEKRELKQMEKELKKRQHGLSYARYSKILNGEARSIFDSDSSWNTHSTGSTSHDSEKNGAIRRAMFLHRRNERPDYVSDAAVASAFADSNASILLKESKVSKSELPTTIVFKPRKNKAKHVSSDSVADKQEASAPRLGAYSFLSANESVQQNTKREITQKNISSRSSSDILIYGKWDTVASGEFSEGSSSAGSLYTTSEDGTDKKSESLSLEGKNNIETRKANKMESMLGLPEVSSPRSEPLLFESSGRNEFGSASPPFKEFIHDSDDEDSFILDDGSSSFGLPSVEGASTSSETASLVSRKKNQHITLLNALTRGCAPRTSDLTDIVNCDTNLVPQPGATDFANCNTNLVPQPGATSPLHDACHEEFPDRFVSPDTNILDVVDQLAKDITERMNKLHFITKYLSHSCMVENHDGDLPVHLLARRLIEWEASWQGRLKLIEVETWSDATKFTQLHKLMGVCVDQVLNPMVRNRLACRSRGKPGTRILPLHAAAMFAVPFDTIQALLESYPEAAHTTCEFGHLHTYISNELLPLQLLERKRSDFVSSPSGRLQAKPSGEEIEPLADEIGGDGGIKWTKSTLCSTNIADDLIRRSDLIFSFNPNILPFRRDAVRIKRIELIIRAEAQVAMARRTKALDATARAAWTWICTFNEPLDEDDTYVDVVGRIVNALDVQTVEFLAALDTPEGTILTAAQPDCAHLIQLKLNGEQIEQCPNKPTSFTPQSSDQSDTRRPSILKPLKTKKDPAYILNGEICRNEFCREVFNVREQAIPTNFVLLPYELLKNEDGSFGLVSPDSASIALQFAGCLTDLTQPWHVNHILEKKAIDCLDHKLTPKRATGFQTFNWRSKNMIQQLQRLFKGKGYLYLLDEETGGPIVSAPSDSNPISAIVVEHPVEAIHNLLPLLLLGMIRMRGDRSIVLIIETMISGKRSPPERWITIMQNITRHLYSRDNKLSNDDKEREELLALSEAVSDFVSRTTKRNTTRRPESDDGREWSSELSYLKRILDGSTAAKLSNVLSTNRQDRVAAKTKAIVVAEPLHNTNEHEDPLSHGTEQDDLLLQRSNEEFDKIWEPENDHSPQEAESEHEHEVSSGALTSFSDGDKLPESISKASSEDDSDKRRKIVIWNGDLSRKEEQVTAVVNHSNTLAKPPEKIRKLEDDHSPQEAEGERELEVSSEALTSFSDGDKLPEPIYKASSEDDSEKRRDIIIWNGDLNRKEEQVTAVVNHSNTLVKPPDKIWELEDDHSPQEAKGEHELEVSSEALTSFSDGNKLPEPISKASSEDDSDKRRKIVIWYGDLNRKEEQVTAVVNHSNTLAKPPDKIWELEDDHSPQEAEGENELEVSSEALTSFSDGDKLPEPIYKASSEDDSDKRRDIIILNGDLNRKEEQVTAVVNHSNTVAKPPRVPKFSSQLTEDKEKKLDEIKLRLQCMDALRCNEDPRCILVKEFANNDGVVDPLLNKDQEEHESHVDDTRDDFSNCLFSRLRSLEERIHDREDEIRELRRDVYSFERKAADAIYESLQDEDSALSKDDYSSSFTSAEGTIIVSCVSKHETVQSTLDDGTETSSSSSVPGLRSANHSSLDDGTETSASSSVPGERSANQSSLDDGTETSASSSVQRVRSANPRFIIKEASDDGSNQSSSSSSIQESAYSSITSMASSFPKRKATFTFEGAFTSTYVSSSSDEDSTQASLCNTDNNSDSTSGTGEGTYEYSNRGKKSENVSLTTDDDSSYDSSSFGNPGSKHTPEKEGNRMDDKDACIPTTVFSSDDLDLLLKSFSVDDGPNVPGNPFSGDEQDAHPDVPGNPFSGDEQNMHPDVPGNPFSGDEQDAHRDVPGNPFGGDEQDVDPDVPGNPFSGDEQDSHPDVPGNPFSGDEQDSHPDVPGNPFSGDEQDAHPDVPGNPLAAMMTTARLRIRLPPKIQIRKVIHAAEPTSTLIQT